MVEVVVVMVVVVVIEVVMVEMVVVVVVVTVRGRSDLRISSTAPCSHSLLSFAWITLCTPTNAGGVQGYRIKL